MVKYFHEQWKEIKNARFTGKEKSRGSNLLNFRNAGLATGLVGVPFVHAWHDANTLIPGDEIRGKIARGVLIPFLMLSNYKSPFLISYAGCGAIGYALGNKIDRFLEEK